jgi:ABC-type transporter Mla subunit MlaD
MGNETKSEIPQSSATQSLIKAQQTLKPMPDFVKTAHAPLTKMMAEFHNVDAVFRQIDNNINDIGRLNRDLGAILKVLQSFSKTIPGIGQALSYVFQTINNLPFRKTIDQTIKALRDVVKQVRT